MFDNSEMTMGSVTAAFNSISRTASPHQGSENLLNREASCDPARENEEQ